jgi:hypothetical protein
MSSPITGPGALSSQTFLGVPFASPDKTLVLWEEKNKIEI